ncbi:hypothetical protein [Endozoicomonas sp. SCSIO W0465]|uniref:hypothetical protein n=1 Tax=Endozoicomonas sp. SCSIO W0465 TaxID=2918516 RepID=UPI0020763B66|nr:hypothetical protein [Endozoicomonas sp. SCSIO W0465]USE38719.1 hypothetical protein MJO57_11415 [Endozoicomonas sp. SCSIO W0465]
MKKTGHLFSASLLIFAAQLSANELPLASFHVDNGWAGEAFHLYNKAAHGYIVVHEVNGSGVQTVSRKKYPVEKLGQTYFAFDTGHLKFTIRLNPDKDAELYLHGYPLETR